MHNNNATKPNKQPAQLTLHAIDDAAVVAATAAAAQCLRREYNINIRMMAKSSVAPA